MGKTYKFILLALCAGIGTYGCGSGGSSTMEMPNNNTQTQTDNVLNGVTLMSSKQGQSVGLADVDGDGIEDKIVGAPYASTSTKTGAVIVYKGSSGGTFSATPTSLISGDDNAGYSFVKLGKGANDASAQFAVSAISGDGDTASLSGTVSIYKPGSSGAQLVKKISGEGAMDKFGVSIAAADFNNDGYTDIAVGAPVHSPEADASLYQQGAAYVFLGPGFTNQISLRASSANKGLGWAVAAGDINGDGISDLLISSTWQFSSTKTYPQVLGFYGGTTFNPNIDQQDVRIYSKSSAKGFGKAITVIGDINADTYGEIAIGAPNASFSSSEHGRVYVIKGGTGARTVDVDTTSADKIVHIDGAGLFARFGTCICPVGDVDADGKPDFVVGATTTDVNADDISGKVYLFKGKDINSSTTIGNSTSFNGTIRDQNYGAVLASAGNGKLLIGAPTSNMNTGGVSMVDLATGSVVADGSSGGATGGGGDCHAPQLNTLEDEVDE